MSEPHVIYTPSELNRMARLHIEGGFSGIWVEGEISNMSRPASGHLYFSLKDESAQLDCALFRSDAARLGFQPANGMQVQARGRLSLYEPRGRYQLIVERLEEAGEGRLRAAFEALKSRLQDEGLFAAEAKQPLPPYPVRVAVITSPGGAVIRDILHVLARRWPLAAVRLYPVPVQGDEAPPAICRALASANRHGWGQVIVVGRGGGSLEDLWAFNDERVARAVHASTIPVISAVGHETDFSICDFVADLRAPTPSAAAELLSPDQAALGLAFQSHQKRLARCVQDSLHRLQQQHDHLAHRLARMHPVYRLREFRKALGQFRTRLAVSARQLIPTRRLHLERAGDRLRAGARQLVPERRRKLAELARTLHAVSPLPTLERGYALLTDASGQRAISSIQAVQPGERISAQLSDGRLDATVDAVSDQGLDDESTAA